MNNTWGFENMKVTEPLRVQWKKAVEKVHAKFDLGTRVVERDFYALKYTRTRTKRWEYIGLTAETAKNCVAQMEVFLNPLQITQQMKYINDDAIQFVFHPDGYEIGEKYFKRFNRGTVSARNVQGESYTVSVDLQEVLSVYATDTTLASNESYLEFFRLNNWSEFETYPSGSFVEFRGGHVSDMKNGRVKDFDTLELQNADEENTIWLTEATALRYQGGGSANYLLFWKLAGRGVEKFDKFQVVKIYKSTGAKVVERDNVSKSDLLLGRNLYYDNDWYNYNLQIRAIDKDGRIVSESNVMPLTYGE